MSTPPLVLSFPAPTRPLSINRSNGLHWGARTKLLNPWKDMALVHARSQKAHRWMRLHRGPVPVSILVDLPFRTANRRDPHNYTGTVVKALVDGLVQAKLIPDDNPEWATVPEPTISIHRDKSMPLMVTVTITPRT